jgi:hypothetical protein
MAGTEVRARGEWRGTTNRVESHLSPSPPVEDGANNVSLLFWALRGLTNEPSGKLRDRQTRVLFDELMASASGVLRKELGEWYGARSAPERDELVSDAVHSVVLAATVGPSPCRAESAGAAWLWCKRILVRSARKAMGREARVRELKRGFSVLPDAPRPSSAAPGVSDPQAAVELLQLVRTELLRMHRADHAESLADGLLLYVEDLLGARLSRRSMLRTRRGHGVAPTKRVRNTAYQRKRRARVAGRAAILRLAERGELGPAVMNCAVMLSLLPLSPR